LYAKADISCTKAIELDDSVVEAWTARGEARLEGEMFEEAVRDYKKAVEMQPNDRDIRRSLHHAESELKKSKRKNYYKILGVGQSAGERELKRAYRKLVKEYHPDKNIGKSPEEVREAEVKFRDVNEAFDILSDPRRNP
jgi:DnaJ-domain-containing protein 1